MTEKKREILFRGKRIDNGEWVEGAPFIFKDSCDMICAVAVHPEFVDEGNVYYSEGFPVDLSTVGQCTGRQDKNGKQIFEGDVLRGFRYRDHGQWGENEPCTYTVSWDDKKSAFYPLYFFDGYTFDIETFEVVGNIYDNPELLEVQND